jgi:hypothetical protein
LIEPCASSNTVEHSVALSNPIYFHIIILG